MSLSELRTKEVINAMTGKRLGHVMDIEFCLETGEVQAIVVPGSFQILNVFRGERNGIVIPWRQICKIGDDIILVQIPEECVCDETETAQ